MVHDTHQFMLAEDWGNEAEWTKSDFYRPDPEEEPPNFGPHDATKVTSRLSRERY